MANMFISNTDTTVHSMSAAEAGDTEVNTTEGTIVTFFH